MHFVYVLYTHTNTIHTLIYKYMHASMSFYIYAEACVHVPIVGCRPVSFLPSMSIVEITGQTMPVKSANWLIINFPNKTSQFADIHHFQNKPNKPRIDSTSHSHYMNTHSIQHHPCFGLGANARVPCAVSGAHTTIFWWVTVTIWIPFLETSHV